MSQADAAEAAKVVRPLLTAMKTSMLTTQYRMHPLIAEWPSKAFYGGRLVSGVSVKERIPPPGIPWRPNVANKQDTASPLRKSLSSMAPILFIKVRRLPLGTQYVCRRLYKMILSGQSCFMPGWLFTAILHVKVIETTYKQLCLEKLDWFAD